MHIHEWLDTFNKDKCKDKELLIVHEFLDYKSMSEVYCIANENKFKDLKVFCIYKNEKYRLTGCSRVGDVWIHSNLDSDHSYVNRVSIKELSGFSHEGEIKDIKNISAKEYYKTLGI